MRPAKAFDQQRLRLAQRRRAKAVAVAAGRDRSGPPTLGQNQRRQACGFAPQSSARLYRSARSTSRAPRGGAARHRHDRRSAPGPWRRYSAGVENSRPRRHRPGRPPVSISPRTSIAAAICAPGVTASLEGRFETGCPRPPNLNRESRDRKTRLRSGESERDQCSMNSSGASRVIAMSWTWLSRKPEGGDPDEGAVLLHLARSCGCRYSP